MLSDIEIAKRARMRPITEVAEAFGLSADDLECFGKYKAKLSEEAYARLSERPEGKLILVTAVNPTPAGEGKTTTTVGLGQALAKLGKKAAIALREPSLGPVFGVKGGAAGGGYAQVVPMEDINLHFTGDIHAVTAANNLLCALLDNHLQQGNTLGIDPRRALFKRAMDMNDRALRHIMVGMGGPTSGVVREDGFMISVASEVMAILCLASDVDDLKRRFGEILVAYTYDDRPVFARDLKAEGAMAALMYDAVKPNFVQTLENTLCVMHGGPFANIAHGCNSVKATKTALKLADYCVTEAGFGADLGAEKFFDIKCRAAGLIPSAAVLVATVRALKYNGGVKKEALAEENVAALRAGSVNLAAHIENLKKFGLPAVVALNRFHTDTDAELDTVRELCERLGAPCVLSEVFAKGGEGGLALAEAVVKACGEPSDFAPLYSDELPLADKIGEVAKKIYGAEGVDFAPAARASLARFTEMGFGGLPVCIAKTQYSLSDNPALLGRPSGFRVQVREARLSAGAGFVVALAGDILTMPGLPKKPAAESIDASAAGGITGLF